MAATTAYQVRERLLRGIPAATRKGLLEQFALIVKSWNLFAKGDTVSMLEFRWTSLEKNAEDFPKVAGAKLKRKGLPRAFAYPGSHLG